MLKKFPKVLGELTGYVIYQPDNYDKNKQYPTIFLFHGIGERGDGSEGGLQNLFDFINSPWNGFDRLKRNEFILIAPQLPWSESHWPLKYADDAMKCAAKFSVDLGRKYLMGISLGGGIAWGYPASSASAGQEFAAIVPICCIGVQGNFCNIKSPVWAFHAADDYVVSPQNTSAAIDQIKACNPPKEPKFKLLPKGGHTIWGLALGQLLNYGESETPWDWMLSQKKAGAPPTTPPPLDKKLTKVINVYSDGTVEVNEIA